MKIALLSFYTLPFCCGNSIFVQRLADGFASRGHEARIFNCRYSEPLEAVSFAPDLIHVLHAERCFAWLKGFNALFRVPVVLSLTGTDYTSWAGIKPPPPIIVQSLKEARALIVFHDQPAHAIGAALPECREKFCVIPQGVAVRADKAERSTVRMRYGLARQHIVFFMAAGIRPIKNIPLAIEAFSRMQQSVPEARLLLAGPPLDSAETERVRAIAEKVACFTYLGEVQPLAVRELLGASDVFLNTSLHEGMSGAILEAMAEGLPVIASDTPGNRALVTENVNGLLFSSNDLAALCDALRKLAKNRSLREQLGKEGLGFASARFSAERELDLYEQVYRRVIYITPQ
jgi:L-malate glycosyltransferase